jgi:hypothetical protein
MPDQLRTSITLERGYLNPLLSGSKKDRVFPGFNSGARHPGEELAPGEYLSIKKPDFRFF